MPKSAPAPPLDCEAKRRLDCETKRRLAVERHVEQVTGNVAMSGRY